MATPVASHSCLTSGFPLVALSSLRNQLCCRKHPIWLETRQLGFRTFGTLGTSADYRGSISCFGSANGSSPVGSDVRFPIDYDELLDQAKVSTELALRDKKQLVEIEFPTAGLESVPGDGEGGIEMTGSMQLIREFCDRFIAPEKAARTRIKCSWLKSFTGKQL
uniref:Protein FAM199X n=1 Tax=Anthurium amnicola TaxID=1678845 RepID=A0A1D1ZK02_9ARAE